MELKIFDTLLEPIFILNSEKKVIYCNQPAANICGLSQKRVLRAGSFSDLFNFNQPLDYLENISALTEPSPYKEITFTTPEGAQGKVQITCQPLEKGESPSWIIYFRDITLEETLQKKYGLELKGKEAVIKDLEKAQSELQNYSKNLENMVAERTSELLRLNQTLAALLDSLGQGFFVFDSQGQCLDITSKACLQILETNPAGKKIWQVLGIADDKVSGFESWIETTFEEILPFADMAALAPTRFKHSQDLQISLEYYPMRNSLNKIEGIVVVASDITHLVKAQKETQAERAHAKMILGLIKNRKEINAFIHEAKHIISEMQANLRKNDFDDVLLYRYYHTVKGGASSFSIQKLADTCHEAENLLSILKKDRKNKYVFINLAKQTQQIEDDFLEFIVDNSLILGRGALKGSRMIEAEIPKLLSYYFKMAEFSSQLGQDFLKDFIMEPIGNFFNYYDEIIQKVAQDLGKEIKPLVIENGTLPIVPEPYGRFFASLIHSFRNSVDHGIESPDTRIEAGKDSAGQIKVAFQVTLDGRLYCTISDDGGGINPEKIRKKLKEKGFDASSESDEDVIQHIFDADFSTRNEVTALSGRGVGMDAIKQSVLELGGLVKVESQNGKGTTLKINLPYFQSLSQDMLSKAA